MPVMVPPKVVMSASPLSTRSVSSPVPPSMLTSVKSQTRESSPKPPSSVSAPSESSLK